MTRSDIILAVLAVGLLLAAALALWNHHGG